MVETSTYDAPNSPLLPRKMKEKNTMVGPMVLGPGEEKKAGPHVPIRAMKPNYF